MLEYLERLASFGNPTLVPILGAEYRDDALWVMSELDEGLPLSELMSRSARSPSHVVSLGLDILAGLQALQQLGLSHGNLHAGNVHVSRQGRARLGDYALRPRFRPDSSRLGLTESSRAVTIWTSNLSQTRDLARKRFLRRRPR